MRRRAAAALAVGWWLAAPGAGAQEPAPGRDLDALRGAIEESRERVGAIEREERALLDALEEIDVRIADLEREVREARRAEAEARGAWQAAEARQVEAARRLAETQQAMSRRAVALYKSGVPGPVRLLFASGSLREFLTRWSSLRVVLDRDAQLVAGFREARDAEAAAREAAAAAAERRAEAAAALERRSAAAADEKRSKRTLLAEVRQDRGRERALLIELERAARALEETVTRLGRSADALGGGFEGSGFEGRRGALAVPVDARIAKTFGRVVDREFQTATFRNGVEFDARAGDGVRAVAPGQVRFAGWFRGYGRIVILDHGDGWFTVSGHLDELFVDVGARVDEGDTLGTVGETGSLSGPALYFEIREGGRPVDPEPWFGG